MWQWFDEIAHRWCGYSTEDSAAMEKAYQAAEPSVKYVYYFLEAYCTIMYVTVLI